MSTREELNSSSGPALQAVRHLPALADNPPMPGNQQQVMAFMSLGRNRIFTDKHEKLQTTMAMCQ